MSGYHLLVGDDELYSPTASPGHCQSHPICSAVSWRFRPLQCDWSSATTLANANLSSQQDMTADLHFHQARLTARTVWLWYVSLSFVESDQLPPSVHSATTLVSRYMAEVGDSILCAEAMLAPSAWEIPADFILWILALQALVISSLPMQCSKVASHFESGRSDARQKSTRLGVCTCYTFAIGSGQRARV